MTEILQQINTALEMYRERPEQCFIILGQAQTACYGLAEADALALSGMASSNGSALKILFEMSCALSYRILFYLLQSPLTSAEFNNQLPNAFKQLAADATVLLPLNSYTTQEFSQLKSSSSFVFGTFVDFKVSAISLPDQKCEAAAALLCLLCRKVQTVRREVLTKCTQQIITFLGQVTFPDVLQPSRVFNLLQILLSIVALPTDASPLHSLTNQGLENTLFQLTKVVFLNNKHVENAIENFETCESSLSEDFCQIYDFEGNLVYKSRELYFTKVLIVLLRRKIMEAEE